MGADIHVKIIKFSSTENKWKPVKLFTHIKDTWDEIPVYDARNYELFDVLTETDFPRTSINMDTLPLDLAAEIEENQQEVGTYSFLEVNLADAIIYLHNHLTILNDKEEEKPSPLKFFLDIIYNYIDFFDPLWNCSATYSQIRIIYWFDR